MSESIDVREAYVAPVDGSALHVRFRSIPVQSDPPARAIRSIVFSWLRPAGSWAGGGQGFPCLLREELLDWIGPPRENAAHLDEARLVLGFSAVCFANVVRCASVSFW